MLSALKSAITSNQANKSTVPEVSFDSKSNPPNVQVVNKNKDKVNLMCKYYLYSKEKGTDISKSMNLYHRPILHLYTGRRSGCN